MIDFAGSGAARSQPVPQRVARPRRNDGGQDIGQALVAAARTVDESIPHSLHACFLRRGDMAMPIVYKVDRVRVGRAFAARRVQAIQHGQPILSMVGTFQKWEEGLVHQVAMPRVPPPGS